MRDDVSWPVTIEEVDDVDPLIQSGWQRSLSLDASVLLAENEAFHSEPDVSLLPNSRLSRDLVDPGERQRLKEAMEGPRPKRKRE